MNQKFLKLGVKPADILLPREADMSRWAVVACDQFTSQPEYWEEVDRIAGMLFDRLLDACPARIPRG